MVDVVMSPVRNRGSFGSPAIREPGQSERRPMDRMHVAVVGSGVSGLSAAYELRQQHQRSRCTSRTPSSVATSRRCASRRPAARSPVDMGFIVYNETTYPRFVGPARRAGRGDPAERHVARLRLPRVRHRVQLARRGGLPGRSFARRPTHPLAHVRRRRALLSATRARRSIRRSATLETLGAWLDERRYGRALPRALPGADRVGRVVDRARADLRLPGRVPAALPRQPRPDRPAPSLQWRTITGGSQTYVQRIVAALPAGAVRRAMRSSPSGATRRRDRPYGRGRVRSDFDAVVMATHSDVTRRCSATPTRRAAGHSRASSTRRTASCSTPTAAPAAPAARVGLVEHRDRGLPAARRAADDDIPHEPPSVAARPVGVPRVGQSRPRPCATRRSSSNAR